MSLRSVHPFTLRFRDPDIEEAFCEDHLRRSWPLVRAALALGLIQYVAFGWLDRWIAPIAFREVRFVRIVVCVVIALAIASSYAPRIRRWVRPALVGALVGGVGVVAMEWAVQQAASVSGRASPAGGLLILDGYYYSGMMLILIYVHVLLRLRFVTATAIGSVLIASYLGVAAFHTPGLQLANAAQFLLSTQLSGMIASYALERYARVEFAHARRQSESNAELAAAFHGLTAAQDRLVHTEKMASLGRVTAGVAHEIQNPLNFVNNFAALAGERVEDLRTHLATDDPEVAEALDDIALGVEKVAEHGGRASGVVRNMLDHSRRGPPVYQPTDLNALVAEHAALAEHAAAAHSDTVPPVLLHLDPDVGVGTVASANLGRALLNVLGNAYDALDLRDAGEVSGDVGTSAPPLRIATHRRDDLVEIEVSDRGIGMAPEVGERALEPFFTTKPTGSGTGLGLSLAYEIVTEGHGGSFEVASEHGVGTTVRITIPLEAEAMTQPDARV